MDRKKKAIILSTLFILSLFLIGIAISQSQSPNTPLAPITYTTTSNIQPEIPPIPKCHATVIVRDCNYIPIEGANVTDGTTTKVTGPDGTVRFDYSSPGYRTFTADYYGEKASKTVYVGSVTVYLDLMNITTIFCRTQYNISGDILPLTSAYITVINRTGNNLIVQKSVNATGWAKFHLVRSDTPGRGTNYNFTAFWLNGTKLTTQEDHSNEYITTTRNLTFTVEITGGQQYIRTEILTGALTLEAKWGTDVYLKIYWRDQYGNNLNTSNPSVGGYVNWTLNFINGTTTYGPFKLTPYGSGGDIYYSILVPSGLLYGGKMYQIYVYAQAVNTSYLPAANQTILIVTPLQMDIAANSVSGIINEQVTLSVQLNGESNTLVTGANVEYTVWDSNNSYIESGTLEESSSTYDAILNLNYPTYSPGIHYIELYAERENYTTVEKTILLNVKSIPSVLSSATFYLSELKNPKIFFCNNYGQTENDVPFAILIFRFERATDKSSISTSEVGGTAISDASVSASGLPSIPLGNGYYAVVIPTWGLPTTAYPLIISASSELYEPQQLVFLLQEKERSVMIPLFDVRVPITILLLVLISMAIPVSGFSGYVYVKRAQIPAIVRRIDRMIVAMSRGEKVDVKIFPRERLTSKILEEEMSIIGMEPRMEVYVPLELAGLIVPLLAESGMDYHEANALVTELMKANPADREKLLQSVGVPAETSATVLKIIEEEEDKRRQRAQMIIRKAVIEKEPEKEVTELEAKREEEGLVRKVRRARKPVKEKEAEVSEEARVEEKEDGERI